MRRHSLPRAAGRVHGWCQGKQMERATARKRRDWRDPWRPVVGRTGRDQARSVRVGVLCLAVGVSTKPRGRALANRGARSCDRRAASKRPAGLRAAGPRLPRSRGLCAATVCAQSRYCGLADRPLGGERALAGYWASERSGGRGRRNRRDAWLAVVGSTRRDGGGDTCRPQAERAWQVLS